MIYINETDQYFSSGLVTRAGFPPYELTENKGLFISEVVVNDYATSVGKVKYIKGLKYQNYTIFNNYTNSSFSKHPGKLKMRLNLYFKRRCPNFCDF